MRFRNALVFPIAQSVSLRVAVLIPVAVAGTRFWKTAFFRRMRNAQPF